MGTMTCSPRCNHNRDSNLKMDKQIGWSLTMNPANMAFIKTSYSRKLLCICEFAYSWSVFLRMQTPNLIWFLYICVPISNGVLATEQVLSKYLLIKWISLHSITFFYNYWVVDTLKILTNAMNPLLKNIHRKTIFLLSIGFMDPS